MMTDRVEELAKALFEGYSKRVTDRRWDLWGDYYRDLANDAMQWFLSTPGLTFDDEAYDEGYQDGYDNGYAEGYASTANQDDPYSL
jgi:hypothetical protein